MRLCRCGEEPGKGQQEGREAWMGRERRGPSRFGAAGGPPEQVPAARARRRASPEGRGAQPAHTHKEAGASSRPNRLSPSPAPPLWKKREIRGPTGMVSRFALPDSRAGGSLSARGVYVPHCRFTDPMAPDSVPRPPASARAPSRGDRGSGAGAPGGVRATPREVRASEPERAGTGARARGGARGRRSGRDTCGCGGGGAGGSSAPGALRRCGGGRALSQA